MGSLDAADGSSPRFWEFATLARLARSATSALPGDG